MKKKKKIDWKHTWKNNCYMLGFIYRSCPGILVLTLVSTVIGAVHSFFLHTYLYQYALNALQEGKPLPGILRTLCILFACSVLYMIFGVFESYYMQLRQPRVEVYIRSMLQEKAARVDLVCFERPQFYDTYVKATGEAASRAFAVMNNLADVLWVVINVLAVGTLIVTIDPIFLVPAILPLMWTLIAQKHNNRLAYEYNMKNREAARKRDYVKRTFYLNEFSKEMRLTGMWRVMLRQMHESVAEMKGIVKTYGFTLMGLAYLSGFICEIVVYYGTVILAVFKTLVRRNMLLGDCFVVINSISSISMNINHVGNVFLKLDENSLYIDNLRAFLEYEVQIAEEEEAPSAAGMKSLELRNVSFTYEGQEKPALHDVSFTVRAGEKIAVVGHNGAGKSTLIKLLLRLYDPGEGQLLLNGQDIRTYRLSSYRNLFGTVFQDYRLFATDIAENVMLRGHLNTGEEARVEEALRQSGIYDKIHSLPQGIHTTVTKEFDPEGAVFSGGEAQKLSIARIFAGEQEIVILDEPTSALDPIAEQEMYQNMFAACQGKTVIFISHRLSSAAMADRVYLFEEGQIVEAGSCRELLALEGKFAEMWHKQADTYVDDALEEVTA